MKKNIVFCFFAVAILSSLFADHDIILAPSVGYTYTNAFTVKNPINPSSENIDYFKAHNGYLEFTVGVILTTALLILKMPDLQPALRMLRITKCVFLLSFLYPALC